MKSIKVLSASLLLFLSYAAVAQKKVIRGVESKPADSSSKKEVCTKAPAAKLKAIWHAKDCISADAILIKFKDKRSWIDSSQEKF
jgi:hypothetical protein